LLEVFELTPNILYGSSPLSMMMVVVVVVVVVFAKNFLAS
jgi:hypothetical protein